MGLEGMAILQTLLHPKVVMVEIQILMMVLEVVVLGVQGEIVLAVEIKPEVLAALAYLQQ
jgi:hypothetical protein